MPTMSRIPWDLPAFAVDPPGFLLRRAIRWLIDLIGCRGRKESEIPRRPFIDSGAVKKD